MSAQPVICNPSDTDKVMFKYCLSPTTGTNFLNFNDNFDYYPNPVNDELHLKLKTKLSGITELKIYDLMGNIIKRENLENLNNESIIKIQVKDLTKGIYLINYRKGLL